jgi:hypothetical protein
LIVTSLGDTISTSVAAGGDFAQAAAGADSAPVAAVVAASAALVLVSVSTEYGVRGVCAIGRRVLISRLAEMVTMAR